MNYNEFVTYVLIAYAVFIAVVFYYMIVRNRGKVKIRVKTPMGEKNHFRKVEPDGKTIIMQKGNKRKKIPEWKFTFNSESMFLVKYMFGFRERKTIDVFYHAPEAIKYHYATDDAETPRFDKKTSKEFIEMEALRKRGEIPKQPLPALFWLMFLTNLMTFGAVVLLMSRMGIF